MVDKDQIEEFLELHQRGVEACKRAIDGLSSDGFSVGDICLGTLYLLDYLSENQAEVLLTARRLMSIYKSEKENIHDTEGAQPQEN